METCEKQRGKWKHANFPSVLSRVFSHLIYVSAMYRATGLQGPGLRGYRPTGPRPTGLQAYRATGLQGYRPTGLQAYRPTGLQAYRATGLQAYRATGLQATSPPPPLTFAGPCTSLPVLVNLRGRADDCTLMYIAALMTVHLCI